MLSSFCNYLYVVFPYHAHWPRITSISSSFRYTFVALVDLYSIGMVTEKCSLTFTRVICIQAWTANLLCAQAISASYPQRDGKSIVGLSYMLWAKD